MHRGAFLEPPHLIAYQKYLFCRSWGKDKHAGSGRMIESIKRWQVFLSSVTQSGSGAMTGGESMREAA